MHTTATLKKKYFQLIVLDIFIEVILLEGTLFKQIDNSFAAHHNFIIIYHVLPVESLHCKFQRFAVLCFRKMRYLEPTHPIRTTFQYNNYMYMLAGYIAEVLEGEEWERINTNLVFKPLGMTSSRYVRDITDDTDFAEAYTLSNNRLVKVRRHTLK